MSGRQSRFLLPVVACFELGEHLLHFAVVVLEQLDDVGQLVPSSSRDLP